MNNLAKNPEYKAQLRMMQNTAQVLSGKLSRLNGHYPEFDRIYDRQIHGYKISQLDIACTPLP